MKIGVKHIIIALGVVILLIAANVYQWQNPQVVEVPSGQTEIDRTAWVKRSAYASQEMILDSLKAQNKKLAKEIKKRGDEIANYTSIVGRLRIEKDSLAWEAEKNNFDISNITFDADSLMKDTVYKAQQTFSDGLFEVQSLIHLDYPVLHNELNLNQLRDIRLDVVNTFNDDHSRLLTYVTSPDFASLEYQSFTELEPKTKFPWFWVGLGVGVVGTGILLK